MKTFISMILSICICAALTIAPSAAEKPYTADWESLKKHEAAPEWFRDAKVGIYFHWGVYSVPAFGSEWYPRNMHIKTNKEYKHHVDEYGEPSEFGYHDFVPMFKAENFDADEWADLFVKAGARFAGPVAEHHDGFAMWNSKLTPWNAMNKGPKRDITGELEKAIHGRGMKFVTSFHHARNSQHQIERNGQKQWTGHYPRVEGWPTVSEDPELRILYGNIPRDQFLDMWVGKLKEVIDNYHPDLIWFDSWFNEIPDAYQMDYLAYYFNSAAARGVEVLTTTKQDLTREIAVDDYEKGRADTLTELPWLTDDTLSKGSWCYTDNLQIKSAEEVIHVLIDIVSKNGQLLLNISPMANGTIPENQRGVLLEMGEWLKTAGESIYDTRPWLAFGEGPTRLKKGGHFVGSLQYSVQDVRYTQSKDGKTLFVTPLGWPEGGFTPRSVQVDAVALNAKVELLGSGQEVAFTVDGDKHITITPPALSEEQRPGKYAYAFKLTGFETSLHPDAAFETRGGIELTVDKAVLDGEKLATETKNGKPNIGFWDVPSESIHWLIRVPNKGTYDVRGTFATSTNGAAVTLEADNASISCNIPNTGGWNTAKTISMGKLTFEKAGIHHIILKAAKPEAWKPVNVFGIKMVPGR